MTLPVLAFFAGSLLTALWIAHRDSRRDADLHDLDAYRKAREALAPVVQLAPRQRGQSSLEFLLGWSSGSSWAQDRPTLTSRSSLRDVSDIEQTFTHPPRANAEGSKHRAVPQRGLSALPRTTGRGRADLLVIRDTTPNPLPGRRRI